MRRPPRRGDRERECGMSTLEVTLLAPLVIGFVMFLVCFGVLVDARGTVQGAARDAARMGSLQRDEATANSAAYNAAVADLGNTCTSFRVEQTSAGFAAGDLYTIRVTCVVSLSGLDWFNVGSQTIVSSSTAPLDIFRRTN